MRVDLVPSRELRFVDFHGGNRPDLGFPRLPCQVFVYRLRTRTFWAQTRALISPLYLDSEVFHLDTDHRQPLKDFAPFQHPRNLHRLILPIGEEKGGRLMEELRSAIYHVDSRLLLSSGDPGYAFLRQMKT